MNNQPPIDKKTIIIAVILLILVSIILLIDPIRQYDFTQKYNAIWNKVISGDYNAAAEDFLDLNLRKHSRQKVINKNSLQFSREFCYMCEKYDKGDYRFAKRNLDVYVSPYLKDTSTGPILNEEQNAYVKRMITAVEEDYAAHKAEYDKEDREAAKMMKEYEKQKAAEEAAKKKEAPYVGMPESDIDTTDLGRHSEYYKRFNTECINGEIYHASMYYWYKGSDLIYSARCVNKKVYNISDHRDDPVIDAKNFKITSTKNKKQQSTTEFDPDDHDIDLYYEDFKDEEGFEDIDDAYDDFEDHPEYWDDY